MNEPAARDLDHAIDQVERRIEVRRNRLTRHVEELRAAARERAKPLPWIGLGVFALAGFAFARGRIGAAARRPDTKRAVERTGVLAGIVGLLQLAARIVSNPLVRSAWNAYRQPRPRAR
jgi:hypothetical protein